MDSLYRSRGGNKKLGMPPPQFKGVHLRSGVMALEDFDDFSRIRFADASDSEDDDNYSSFEEEERNECLIYSDDSSLQEEDNHDLGRRLRQPLQYSRAYEVQNRGMPAVQQQQQRRERKSERERESDQSEIHQRNFLYSQGPKGPVPLREDDYSDGNESFDGRDRYAVGDHSGVQYSSSSGLASYEEYVKTMRQNEIRPVSRNRCKEPSQSRSRPLQHDGRPINETKECEMPTAPPMAFSETATTGIGLRPTSGSCTTGPSAMHEQELNSSCSTGIYPDLNKGLEEQHEPLDTIGNAANMGSGLCDQPSASSSGLPTFQISGQGAWQALLAYEACVRLCLRAWARGCIEAPGFLHNECITLRRAFGLQQMLLQPEEELLRKSSTETAPEGAAPKPRKAIGKIKVQVRKVRMMPDLPSRCSFLPLHQSCKLDTVWACSSSVQSTCLAGWEAVKKIRVTPHPPLNVSYSQRGVAYMQASAEYVKQVLSILKTGVVSLRNSSANETAQESYSCLLRLKSSVEEETFRAQPGSGETHLFLPESLGDDLIIEVQDSKGNVQGRSLIQLASLTEDTIDKTRWCSIFREPEHEIVGKLQLFLSYITNSDETGALKCGSVAETVAYDLVLEVSMKVQKFRQRHLQINGPWKWLLDEFASYYGVSDSYTKLRYLSCIMDVATPTEDCLVLIYDLLSSVIRARDENSLSRQEKRILGEVQEHVDRLLALVFENYKSLDDSIPSGLMDVFEPPSGVAAKALAPAVKIYTLIHDILSPEAQLTLCGYFQIAAKNRCKRHMAETDEFVANNNEGILMDPLSLSTAYLKMKALCVNIRNEVYTDIEIHNQDIFPSSIDLPNIAAAIYNADLCTRLRAFLTACPPPGPLQPVVELVMATADFQRDLMSWNISPVKGGVDAKDLFHLYIVNWIQDKRLSLLDLCKPDKVRMTTLTTTQHLVAPFVEEMYEHIRETLNEYEIIVCRWPEYTFSLEIALADVEKAMVEAMEKQYADVLAPLKDSMMPKKFGLQYVQKWTKRGSVSVYNVPSQLGILLNTIKRMLDVLRPKIELQLKSWVSCLPEGACGNMIFGERIGEITVMLRAKFKNTMQAIIEKLADNTKIQKGTKIKRIIQDTKEAAGEMEVRERMQALNIQLTDTISNLHEVFTSRVFVAICRGFWDRMGQDVLKFLENRKENRSWYKGARITVGILDDTFASQMQRLQGNLLQEKDVDPPRSVVEVRSMLCKDASNSTGSSNFYF